MRRLINKRYHRLSGGCPSVKDRHPTHQNGGRPQELRREVDVFFLLLRTSSPASEKKGFSR